MTIISKWLLVGLWHVKRSERRNRLNGNAVVLEWAILHKRTFRDCFVQSVQSILRVKLDVHYYFTAINNRLQTRHQARKE